MIQGKALPPGTIVGRDWRVERMLGEGGFGITYEARHQVDDRRVALKEYLPFGCGSRIAGTSKVQAASGREGEIFAWGRERFMHEAATLARLDHPSIVRVTSYFEANGTAYMTLDYEDGGTFGAWLRKLNRPPDQHELDKVVYPLLEALTQIHSLFLMHRDIKPENIMMRSDGTPVLIDFGTAKLALAGRTRLAADVNPAVRGTLAVVTDGYSPPEQYDPEGRHQGPWTDIYSLAATLYCAIRGRSPPFAMQRMIEDGCDVLADLAGARNWRPQFLSGIDSALALRPTARPQSAIEFRRLLGIGETTSRPPSSAGGLPKATGLGEAAARRQAAANGAAEPAGGTAAPPSTPTASGPSAPASAGLARAAAAGSSPPDTASADAASLSVDAPPQKAETGAGSPEKEIVDGPPSPAIPVRSRWRQAWPYVLAAAASLGLLVIHENAVLVPARVAKAAADQAARLELERIQAGVQQQQLATCRKDLAPLPQVLSEFRLVRNKRIATATGASTEYSSKASIKVGKTLAEHARACAELCRAARTCAGFDEIGDDSCLLYKAINVKSEESDIDDGDDCNYYYIRR